MTCCLEPKITAQVLISLSASSLFSFTVTDVPWIILSLLTFSFRAFWLYGLKMNSCTLDEACCLSSQSSSRLFLLSCTTSIFLRTNLHSPHKSTKATLLTLSGIFPSLCCCLRGVCHNLHLISLTCLHDHLKAESVCPIFVIYYTRTQRIQNSLEFFQNFLLTHNLRSTSLMRTFGETDFRFRLKLKITL